MSMPEWDMPALEASFVAEKANGVQAVMQLTLSGFTFHLVIRNNNCRAVCGPAVEPDVCVITDSATLIDIGGKRTSLETAEEKVKLKIEGDRSGRKKPAYSLKQLCRLLAIGHAQSVEAFLQVTDMSGVFLLEHAFALARECNNGLASIALHGPAFNQALVFQAIDHAGQRTFGDMCPVSDVLAGHALRIAQRENNISLGDSQTGAGKTVAVGIIGSENVIGVQ